MGHKEYVGIVVVQVLERFACPSLFNNTLFLSLGENWVIDIDG